MVRGGAVVAVALSIYLSGAVSSVPAHAQDPNQAWLPTAIRSVEALFDNPGSSNAGVRLVRQEGSARPAARSRQPVPPLPIRKTAKGAATLPEPDVWSEEQIAQALTRCTKLLKKVDAVLVHEPPLKQGKCGTAAPVRLMSLGKKHKVSFSPPALVDCRMVAALDRWIRQSVQPLAKKHLGERIAKVSVMSDYSCRRSTGRRNRWSQHAFVDALDIRGFVTETGRKTYVLDTWGETKRDVAARIAAAKAKAAQAKLEKMAAETAPKKAIQKSDEPDESKAGKTVVVAARLGGPNGAKGAAEKNSLRSRAIVASLGGGVPPIPLPQDAPPKPESKFLRAAHKAACGIFGTTLGPEANEAHRNHFHVDMAERKYKKICD